MLPFAILPVASIKKWLRALSVPGQIGKMRAGPTLPAISRHTGIPMNDLRWFAFNDNSAMNQDRQRLFSKVIAQIENGQLEFERGPNNTKVGVLRDKPRPIVRHTIQFGARGPRLVTKDRPPAWNPMPTFRNLLK